MSSKSDKHAFEWITAALFLIFAGVALYAFVTKFTGSALSPDGSDWGTFGDYIGGVIGTLVSVAAFVMLVRTIYLQKKMIVVATDQLAAAETQLIQTTAEMNRSTAVLRRQAFETTFFSLIKRVRDAATSNVRKSPNEGETLAAYLAERCVRAQVKSAWYASTPQSPDKFLSSIQDIFSGNQDWTEPFFRLIYHTLKWVHYSELPESERMRYASMFRSQFSDSELICLYFNLAIHADSGLTHYVNFYGLLKHIPKHIRVINSIPISPLGGVDESAFQSYGDRQHHNVRPHKNIELETSLAGYFT